MNTDNATAPGESTTAATLSNSTKTTVSTVPTSNGYDPQQQNHHSLLQQQQTQLNESRTILTIAPKFNQTSQQFMSTSNVTSSHNTADSSDIIHITTSSLTQTQAPTETPSTIVVERKHVVTHQQAITSTNSSTSPSVTGDVCPSPIAIPMTTTLVPAHNSNLLNHHYHQHQQHVHHHINQSSGASLLISNAGSSTPTSAGGTLLANNPQNLGKYWVVTNLFQGTPGQSTQYNEGGGVTHAQTSIAGVPSSTLIRAIPTTAGSTTVIPKTEVVSSSAGTLQIPQTQMLSQASIAQQLPNGTIITTQSQQQLERHMTEHQQQQHQLHVHALNNAEDNRQQQQQLNQQQHVAVLQPSETIKDEKPFASNGKITAENQQIIMQHISAAAAASSGNPTTSGATTITLGTPKTEIKDDGSVVMSGKLHSGFEMYKVNIEDISQLFTYHEVFGKMHGDVMSHPLTAAHTSLPSTTNSNISVTVSAANSSATETNNATGVPVANSAVITASATTISMAAGVVATTSTAANLTTAIATNSNSVSTATSTNSGQHQLAY
ncbi:hypothetical protein EVAR_71399_1 [Eumeta japonica]|uniref:Uncharacterized protein n=1 Tax=Eumeta variegata TaxID=151549 RepID=A0A4C2A6C6_EUMVA|nr:hypothetical protein EVAR_71399_1 [Eumeta japonica]